MEIEKFDTWLGAIQKVAVIIGLIVSAWIFLIKEETSPHVKIDSMSKMLNHCILRTDIQVENKGGRAWTVENAIVRAFKPSFEEIQDSKNLKDHQLGTQILKINQALLVGEIASFGFNLKLPPKNDFSFVIVKAAITIKEDGSEWLRLAEEAVPVEKCD